MEGVGVRRRAKLEEFEAFKLRVLIIKTVAWGWQNKITLIETVLSGILIFQQQPYAY